MTQFTKEELIYMQMPISACIQDLKAVNKNSKEYSAHDIAQQKIMLENLKSALKKLKDASGVSVAVGG